MLPRRTAKQEWQHFCSQTKNEALLKEELLPRRTAKEELLEDGAIPIPPRGAPQHFRQLKSLLHGIFLLLVWTPVVALTLPLGAVAVLGTVLAICLCLVILWLVHETVRHFVFVLEVAVLFFARGRSRCFALVNARTRTLWSDCDLRGVLRSYVALGSDSSVPVTRVLAYATALVVLGIITTFLSFEAISGSFAVAIRSTWVNGRGVAVQKTVLCEPIKQTGVALAASIVATICGLVTACTGYHPRWDCRSERSSTCCVSFSSPRESSRSFLFWCSWPFVLVLVFPLAMGGVFITSLHQPNLEPSHVVATEGADPLMNADDDEEVGCVGSFNQMVPIHNVSCIASYITGLPCDMDDDGGNNDDQSITPELCRASALKCERACCSMNLCAMWLFDGRCSLEDAQGDRCCLLASLETAT